MDATESGWFTDKDIDSILRFVEDRGGFREGSLDLQKAVDRGKRDTIRNLIRSMKDEKGNPVFANIKRIGQDGKPHQSYKQEMLFDGVDCRTARSYHAERATHHIKETRRMERMASKRFGIQLHFDFSEFTDRQSAPKRAEGKRYASARA